MEVFDKIVPIPNLSLALGFFDGVHLGHQKVVQAAVDGVGQSAVITFKESPAKFFSKEPIRYISTREERRAHIEALGVDYLFELDFTQELAQMTGEEYLRDILVKNFSPKKIVTGFDHTFGKSKSGTPKMLSEFQSELGYEYVEIPEQTIDGVVISSTVIKDFISKGEIELANRMLGYDFELGGVVIEGKKLGRTIGFPTANVRYPEGIVEIPCGVYASSFRGLKTITNYGTNPTIPKSEKIIETHILDFDGDLYGQEVKISIGKKIRDEKKFDSVYDLKQQIKRDIQEC